MKLFLNIVTSLAILLGVFTVFAISAGNGVFTESVIAVPVMVAATFSKIIFYIMMAALVLSIYSRNTLNSFLLLVLASAILLITSYSATASTSHSSESIKVMEINALLDNKDGGYKIADEITKENPDILVVAEYSDELVEGLSKATSHYPYSYIATPLGDGIADLALFSKYELTNKRNVMVQDRPTLYANFVYNNQTVTVAAVHTMSPTDKSRAATWIQELENFESSFKVSNPIIAAGDFNANVGHPPFRRMLSESGLVNISNGLRTWSHKPGVPAYIQLDHILVSHQWKVKTPTRVGEGFGSDHKPLIVEISLD